MAENMRRNDRMKFRDLFDSEKAMLREMLRIQALTIGSRDEQIEWARCLRFLEIPTGLSLSMFDLCI
jgi:hypothetical protein